MFNFFRDFLMTHFEYGSQEQAIAGMLAWVVSILICLLIVGTLSLVIAQIFSYNERKRKVRQRLREIKNLPYQLEKERFLAEIRRNL